MNKAQNELAGGLLMSEISDALMRILESVSKGELRLSDEMRRGIIREVIEIIVAGGWREALPYSLELANSLLDDIAVGFEKVHDYIVDLRAALIDYGLVGMGSGILATIFGVGLEFDWLLGIPYYPSSTLKGAARSAAEAILGDEEAEALFGSPGDKGWIGIYTFAPAYPVGCKPSRYPCLIITGDVLTPHYFKPGRGLVESELDVEPNPVVHAAIAPGTVFRFIIGIKRPTGRIRGRVEDALRVAAEKKLISKPAVLPGVLAELAFKLLGSALLTGFAARSGKGYNIFEILAEDEWSAISRSVVSIRLKPSSTGVRR